MLQSDIQDFPSHSLCNATDMLWTQRTSDVRHAEKRFIHNELQSSAGGHDGQISSTFYWFDCDIADSSLPPIYNRLQRPVSLQYIYIKSLNYIHTSTVTAINHLVTIQEKLMN